MKIQNKIDKLKKTNILSKKYPRGKKVKMDLENRRKNVYLKKRNYCIY